MPNCAAEIAPALVWTCLHFEGANLVDNLLTEADHQWTQVDSFRTNEPSVGQSGACSELFFIWDIDFIKIIKDK